MFKYLKPAGFFFCFYSRLYTEHTTVTINTFFLVENLCTNFVAVRSQALGKRKLVKAIMASL